MNAATRHFLRLLMVAVALCASSLSGYMGVLAAFDVHAHGQHGAHAHDHSHLLGAISDEGQLAHADHARADHGAPHSGDEGNSNHVCAHMHVSCCGSFAVPAAECGLKLKAVAHGIVAIAHSSIPHGVIASPLFRPPRALA